MQVSPFEVSIAPDVLQKMTIEDVGAARGVPACSRRSSARAEHFEPQVRGAHGARIVDFIRLHASFCLQ